MRPFLHFHRIFKNWGGGHMYKGVGFRFADFISCFLNSLIETKLFLFHRIYKNWGGEGGSNPLIRHWNTIVCCIRTQFSWAQSIWQCYSSHYLFAYWEILHSFLSSSDFCKINFFGKKIFQEYQQCVKQFGCRSGPTFWRAWPRGYKTFSILNSAEHEIYPAHKY